MDNQPMLGSILTAQEHSYIGSTPPIPVEEEGDWYKPQGFLTNEYSLEQLRAARAEKGFTASAIIAALIGEGQSVAISLEEIDETGHTISDPKILGVWDEDEHRIVEDPSLTERVFKLFERLRVEPHRREVSLEGENQLRSPEKE